MKKIGRDDQKLKKFRTFEFQLLALFSNGAELKTQAEKKILFWANHQRNIVGYSSNERAENTPI